MATEAAATGAGDAEASSVASGSSSWSAMGGEEEEGDGGYVQFTDLDDDDWQPMQQEDSSWAGSEAGAVAGGAAAEAAGSAAGPEEGLGSFADMLAGGGLLAALQADYDSTIQAGERAAAAEAAAAEAAASGSTSIDAHAAHGAVDADEHAGGEAASPPSAEVSPAGVAKGADSVQDEEKFDPFAAEVGADATLPAPSFAAEAIRQRMSDPAHAAALAAAASRLKPLSARAGLDALADGLVQAYGATPWQEPGAR